MKIISVFDRSVYQGNPCIGLKSRKNKGEYLKAEETVYAPSDVYMCRVSLPNKEISFVYSKEILAKSEPIVPQSLAISIQESIYRKQVIRTDR